MNINIYIKDALAEDISSGDITTNLLIPSDLRSEAQIISKEAAVICGLDIAQNVFKHLDKHVKFRKLSQDGQFVKNGTVLAIIRGRTRVLLTGERVALNFLGHLSGIASLTRQFARKVNGTKARIYDTRKTTPGLRELEKYAVRCGGGYNHRSSLNEMVLIKDNHRECIFPQLTIEGAILRLRNKTRKTIEIEVDNLSQFKKALAAGVDIILLDNMSVSQISECVRTMKNSKSKHPALEASGGVNLSNVGSIARCGVGRISVGALTHSAPATNISMEISRSWER